MLCYLSNVYDTINGTRDWIDMIMLLLLLCLTSLMFGMFYDRGRIRYTLI